MKELIEILRHLKFTTTNSEGKEVVFLPTISEFILANDLSPIRLNGGYDRVMSYTKFLTQPITLSMLGTGMSEPALFNHWSSEKHGHGMSLENGRGDLVGFGFGYGGGDGEGNGRGLGDGLGYGCGHGDYGNGDGSGGWQ